MPIGDRLIHDLVIVTPTTDGTLDEYGQPVAGIAVTVAVAGLVQPKKAGEVDLISQAGAQLADHVIFLQPQTLAQGAYLRFEPDDGDRYEVVGVRGFDYGRDPHLEVDCHRITSESLTVAS